MSIFKNRRLATICGLVLFSFVTLSFFRFPSGPSQSKNIESTVEVAPEPSPNDTSEPESLPVAPVVPVVPVDLFGVESNLIGSPTPQFRGPSCHPTFHTFELTVQPQIICEVTVNTLRPGYQLVGVRRSLYPLSFLLTMSSSQRCHDLCEPTSHSILLFLTCAAR